MSFLPITCLLVLSSFATASSGSFQRQFFTESAAVATEVDTSKSLPEKTVTPTLAFTTNTTKVESGEPFLVSCTISNFTEHASRNYSVRFYRTNRLDSRQCGPTYQLNVFEEDTPDDYFSARPGAHFAYPTFEAVITTRPVNSEADLRKNYWCELVVLEKEEKKEDHNVSQPSKPKPKPLTVVSNVWVNTPLVRLVISGPLASDPTNTTFVASCQIYQLVKRLQTTGPELQVKLLLAQYSPISGLPLIELAHFQVPTPISSSGGSGPVVFQRSGSYLGRSAVSPGDNVALPTFDFLYRTGGSKEKHYFACRLEDPRSSWKHVTSSRVLHV